MGVPQNVMRALCAVIRPDHFKFASYRPGLNCQHNVNSINSHIMLEVSVHM